MSIYFSTGGYKNHKTKDVVNQLIKIGIKNIELSGGTTFYNGFVEFYRKSFFIC